MRIRVIEWRTLLLSTNFCSKYEVFKAHTNFKQNKFKRDIHMQERNTRKKITKPHA
jgi:hypothetical protein